jgi:hypothetical protein
MIDPAHAYGSMVVGPASRHRSCQWENLLDPHFVVRPSVDSSPIQDGDFQNKETPRDYEE